MTSMRMRLLFSLSFVHVLVRYIGGEGGGGGVAGGRGHAVHANATFVFSFLCSRAGAVHWWGGGWWGGGGGDDVHANATFVFSFFFHLVLISSGAVHM